MNVILCTFWRCMESTSQLPFVLVSQFIVSFPMPELCYKCFSYNDIFFMTLGLRSFLVRCIMYGNNVSNNVWRLRFVFVRYCDDSFFTSSQLRYLLIRCSYVFWWPTVGPQWAPMSLYDPQWLIMTKIILKI